MSKKEVAEKANFELPVLNTMKAAPVSLVSNYWTPEDKGEEKRVFVIGFQEDVYESEEKGEILLECAFLLEQSSDGTYKRWRNGSKRLVASLKKAVSTGEIITLEAMKQTGEMPTGVQITYTGKQKNKINSFQSDRWEIFLLTAN